MTQKTSKEMVERYCVLENRLEIVERLQQTEPKKMKQRNKLLHLLKRKIGSYSRLLNHFQ